jgi:hypothetical protein
MIKRNRLYAVYMKWKVGCIYHKITGNHDSNVNSLD